VDIGCRRKVGRGGDPRLNAAAFLLHRTLPGRPGSDDVGGHTPDQPVTAGRGIPRQQGMPDRSRPTSSRRSVRTASRWGNPSASPPLSAALWQSVGLVRHTASPNPNTQLRKNWAPRFPGSLDISSVHVRTEDRMMYLLRSAMEKLVLTRIQVIRANRSSHWSTWRGDSRFLH